MKRKTFEVEINPEIIKWARETSGWTEEEVAKRLRTSLDNYRKIESGKKKPTYKQIEILADCFRRPVATFFLPEPPKEPPIASSFRILPKTDITFHKELLLAIRKARNYQSNLNELLPSLGISPEPDITKRKLEDDPLIVASEEREKLGISLERQLSWKNPYSAFNEWRSAIEKKGIFVFQFKFPLESARGFSLLDKNPPVIAINSTDNILARIFTLFHEYAHILLGITEIYQEELYRDQQIENWCDTFASEILVPESALKKDEDFQKFFTSKQIQPDLLEKLSQKFKVSKKAILTRLRTLNLITFDEYQEQSKKLEQTYQPKKEGFITPDQRCIQEKGPSFIYYVLQSKEKGIITTHDAIRLLSIKLKHIERIEKLIWR